MASDGNIDKREVAEIKTVCEALPSFKNVDLEEEINGYVSEINAGGRQFIKDYFTALALSNLTEQEELTLIDVAIKIIKADDVIEYSEIKFFKNIRYRLKVNDEKIMEHFSSTVEEIYLFLGEDIVTTSFLEKIENQYFDTVELPEFGLININTETE
jgi:uncharacterized tellurite resistance protein B-like protein